MMLMVLMIWNNQQNIWEGGCERYNKDNNSMVENYPCSYEDNVGANLVRR